MNSLDWEDKTLTLTDGVKLVSRLWKPVGLGPWPVLLMRQPYSKAIASSLVYPHPKWWASHGFLVVVQDVRGQGESTGIFQGFQQESKDTTQSMQWIRSLPECNGRIGTYGFSYQGLTQLLAENDCSPPDCLAPAMTGLSEKDHWCMEGNAFWWHIGISWGLQLAAQKLRREGNQIGWNEIRESLDNGNYLIKGVELLERFDPEGMVINWFYKSEHKSNNWKTYEPLTSWLKKPMLLIGGWWDPHLNGIIDIYKKAKSIGGNPEIHIGPATHLNWWNEVKDIQLNFFNQNLKKLNQDNSSININSNKSKFWNITSNKWGDSSYDYDLNHHLFYLGCRNLKNCDVHDGVLSDNPHSIISSLEIVHDPWRPVPAIGGHLSQSPGQADRTLLDKRRDVATFTSSPQENTLSLKGIPKIEIQAKSDQKGFDLCASLSIVNIDSSKVNQISTGFLRIRGQGAMSYKNLEIKLQPIFATIAKGTRLRISLSGAAWPAIGINPGNESAFSGPPSSEASITSISLRLNNSKLKFLPILSI